MAKRAPKKKTKKIAKKKTAKKPAKKAAPKKTVKKKVSSKKTSTKKAAPKKASKKAVTKSENRETRQAYLKIYQNLQAQVEKTWKQIQTNLKKKAKPEVIEKDKKHLLLLLGECNYMANECKKMMAQEKKK